jgi:hypothetical protein
MVLPAAEGATQIETTSVAGIREKTNPAVATGHHALVPIRIRPQNRAECYLVLTDKRIRAIILVPVLGKRENLLQRYKKSARFSVRIWICCCISSSYRLDAKPSRGRARIFLRLSEKHEQANRTTQPGSIDHQSLSSYTANSTSPRPVSGTDYLEKKQTEAAQTLKLDHETPLFFSFQVAGKVSSATGWRKSSAS